MEEKKKKAQDLLATKRVKHPRAKRTPIWMKIMQSFRGKDKQTLEEISESTGINLLSLERSLRALTKDGVLEETPEGWSRRKVTGPLEPEIIGPFEQIKIDKIKRIKHSGAITTPGGGVLVYDEKTLKKYLRKSYIIYSEEKGEEAPKHWTLRRSSNDEKVVWDCDLSSRNLTIDNMVEMGYTIIRQGVCPTGTIYKKWWQIRRHPHA